MTAENLPHSKSSPHAAHAKDGVNISPSPASGGGLGWGQKTVANYGNINKYLLIGLAIFLKAVRRNIERFQADFIPYKSEPNCPFSMQGGRLGWGLAQSDMLGWFIADHSKTQAR